VRAHYHQGAKAKAGRDQAQDGIVCNPDGIAIQQEQAENPKWNELQPQTKMKKMPMSAVKAKEIQAMGARRVAVQDAPASAASAAEGVR